MTGEGPFPSDIVSLRFRRWAIPQPRRPWIGVERLGLRLECLGRVYSCGRAFALLMRSVVPMAWPAVLRQ